MKKLVTTVLAIAAVSAFAATAFATNLLSEGFNYANGNLVPNGGWANHSGANVDIQVANGRATGLGPNANDVNRAFAPQGATAATYMCFEVVISPPVTAGGTPRIIYFIHMKDTGTSNFPGRVFIVPDGTSPTTFKFATGANTINATVGPTVWATPSTYNTRYFIVVKYDAAAGTSTLWVNPSSEASTSITTPVDLLAKSFLVSAVALRQAGATTTTLTAGTSDWAFSVDNIGIGTTFGDACAQVTPTERSTWGRIKTIYR